MLSNIHFKGFDITSHEFKEYHDAENGFFDVEFNSFTVTSYEDEEALKYIEITVSPSLVGYDKQEGEADKSVCFELNASLVLTFQVVIEENIPESLYDENEWFFDNFVAISTKLSLESLLKHTPLSGIKLPWRRPA